MTIGTAVTRAKMTLRSSGSAKPYPVALIIASRTSPACTGQAGAVARGHPMGLPFRPGFFRLSLIGGRGDGLRKGRGAARGQAETAAGDSSATRPLSDR
ncbi:hypothetical protein Q0Z83_009550 [Actinoplanes sichuanensis]|nr:hypothetical protein Q0Z83_009550 [Actinoplanes sichuanensis]